MYTYVLDILYYIHIIYEHMSMCVYAHTQRKLTSTFSSFMFDLFLTYGIYMFRIYIHYICSIYTEKNQEWMEKITPRFFKVIGYKIWVATDTQVISVIITPC